MVRATGNGSGQWSVRGGTGKRRGAGSRGIGKECANRGLPYRGRRGAQTQGIGRQQEAALQGEAVRADEGAARLFEAAGQFGFDV